MISGAIMENLVDTSNLLLSSHDSTEALDRVYKAIKLKKNNLTLANLCKKSGISSKGYLSDVLKGKRFLNMKYLDGLTTALEIKGINFEYFKILLERDLTKDPSAKTLWSTKLEELKKAYRIVKTSEPVPQDTALIEFELFCAFGLFKGTPSRKQLLQYFGKDRAFEIDEALHHLEAKGWIEKISNPKNSTNENQWGLVVNQIAFSDDKGNMSHEDFLRQAIISAAENVSQWHGKKAEAHFESFIISVKEETYKEILADLKDQLLSWHSKLETTQADQLIRFNVQIYPIKG